MLIVAPKCSLKPLSKAVTSALKLMYQQIENYNNKKHFFSGVKTFWPIQNNVPVINNIKKLNKRHKALSVSSFDFSTLYTNIPHDKLLHVLNELIDFCFQGGTNDIIAVDRFGAKWVHSATNASFNFDKSSLKTVIKYLINNCYFNFGNKTFRQVVGIPMGSDPAPFMANLFLYFYENKWIQKTKRTNLRNARMFGNTFRFIDDLMAINDDGLFESYYQEIYPPELELKKENVGNREATFLDLNIVINNNTFQVSLYDKRDSFPFTIVRMPYHSSNMPSKIFYSSLGAEILRIGKANNNSCSFYNSARIIVQRMIKQGGKITNITKTLKKVFCKHYCIFNNFTESIETFINNLIH